MKANEAMNRRIDIDLEVQWPPARSSEKWPMQQQLASEDEVQALQPDECIAAAGDSLEAEVKTYGSSELFEGAKEVGIKHAGSVYRLKITRQGKLILNK
ncbi:hypothetical protein ACI0FR_01488 [Paenochrobactrum sp. BZR 201-1]